MTKLKAAKAHYSEEEAATELGLSVDELRELVRRHIVTDEDGGGAPPTYRSTDLVLLRILAKMTPAHPRDA